MLRLRSDKIDSLYCNWRTNVSPRIYWMVMDALCVPIETCYSGEWKRKAQDDSLSRTKPVHTGPSLVGRQRHSERDSCYLYSLTASAVYT